METHDHAVTPLILSLDTSQSSLSLAILRGPDLLHSSNDYSGSPHSQRLFPLLHYVLDSLSLLPTDLNLIAVNTGPGSFTGLRVGLAAAIGLAATLKIPLFGMNAFDALALLAGQQNWPIVVVINASKGEVFWGIRKVKSNGQILTIGTDHVGSFEQMHQMLRLDYSASNLYFIGNGASQKWTDLAKNEPRWHLLESPAPVAPKIGEAARWHRMNKSPSTIEAYYIRPSEAEIKHKK